MRDINSLLEELDVLGTPRHPDSLLSSAMIKIDREAALLDVEKQLPIVLSSIITEYVDKEKMPISRAENKARSSEQYKKLNDKYIMLKREALISKAKYENKLNRREDIKTMISVEQSLMKIL